MDCTHQFILFLSYPIPVHHQWKSLKLPRNCMPEAPGTLQTTVDGVLTARRLAGDPALKSHFSLLPVSTDTGWVLCETDSESEICM